MLVSKITSIRRVRRVDSAAHRAACLLSSADLADWTLTSHVGRQIKLNNDVDLPIVLLTLILAVRR